MPFEFPLNPDEQKTYLEDFLVRLQTLNDQAEPFQVDQPFEPTQSDWITAWEAEGNTGPIPADKDLFWFDGSYLRGQFTSGGSDLISPFLYPYANDQWPVAGPTFDQNQVTDVRWRTNDDLWGIIQEAGATKTPKLARMFPDGSYQILHNFGSERGSIGEFIGSHSDSDFAPLFLSSKGVEIENTVGGSLTMYFDNTTTPVAGQVVRAEITITKRESGNGNVSLHVGDTAGSESNSNSYSFTGAEGPRKLSVQITATGSWTGIRVQLGVNAINHKAVFSGIRLFVDGVELTDEANFNFSLGTTTNWTVAGGLTTTILDTFWAAAWDGSAINWIVAIPEGPVAELQYPFHAYELGGVFFVVFNWLDVSIASYDTTSVVSTVLANAAAYAGGTIWEAFTALDRKIYARNDTNAIRRFDEDGANNVAITVDVTEYSYGYNGFLYRVEHDPAVVSAAAWYESVDIYDVANDSETLADRSIFAKLVDLSQKEASYEALSSIYAGDSVNNIGQWTFEANPFYDFLKTPKSYCERVFVSPNGDRLIASEEAARKLDGTASLDRNFILLAPNGGTGRIFRVTTWSDPRPDFKILQDVEFGAQSFSTIEFDLTAIEDLEYYGILLFDLAVEPTVSNQVDIHVQFNDDTAAANYASYLYVQSAGVRSHDEAINTKPGIHLQAWQNGTSAYAHMFHLYLMDHQSSTKKQTVVGHGIWTDVYALGSYKQQMLCGIWDSTAPLEKVTFTVENIGLGERLGAFAGGGRIRLIGIKTRSRYARDGNDPFFMA